MPRVPICLYSAANRPIRLIGIFIITNCSNRNLNDRENQSAWLINAAHYLPQLILFADLSQRNCKISSGPNAIRWWLMRFFAGSGQCVWSNVRRMGWENRPAKQIRRMRVGALLMRFSGAKAQDCGWCVFIIYRALEFEFRTQILHSPRKCKLGLHDYALKRLI